MCTPSLPSWERGLKFYQKELHIFLYIVAPLVRAWIEILKGVDYYPECDVAPLVGAWIEIGVKMGRLWLPKQSLPSWERGLKFIISALESTPAARRSPRGSVD